MSFACGFTDEETKRFGKCPKHDRVLSLHCRSVGCDVNICQMCLISVHQCHDVIDVLSEEVKNQSEEVESLVAQFEQYQTGLQATREMVTTKCIADLTMLQENKEDFGKTCDDVYRLIDVRMQVVLKSVKTNSDIVVRLLFSLRCLRARIQLGRNVDATGRKLLQQAEDFMLNAVRDHRWLELDDDEVGRPQKRLRGKVVEKRRGLPKLVQRSTFRVGGLHFCFLRV